MGKRQVARLNTKWYGAQKNLVGFLIVLVLGLIVPLWAGVSGSEMVEELNYRDEPYGMHFVDNVHGWAVGDQGLMLETKDGGMSWVRHERTTIQPFFDIDFVNPQKGWIVGSKGLILHTKDGGKHWERQESGADKHIMAVEFLDESRGVAVGAFGTVLRTADGGTSWDVYPIDWDNELVEVVETTGIAEPHLYDISFVEECGFIAGENGVIMRSTDGGTTWDVVHGGIFPPVFSACYTDCSTGWAVGQNGFALTTHNGESWEKVELPATENLTKVRFAGDRGVIVGDYGTVLTTGDGGATWQRMPDNFGGRWLMDVCLFTCSNTNAAIIGAGLFKQIQFK